MKNWFFENIHKNRNLQLHKLKKKLTNKNKTGMIVYQNESGT